MLKRLNRLFLTGLLVLLPLFLSIYILFLAFRFTDGILGNFVNVYFQKAWGFYIPGIGLIFFFAIVLTAGLVSSYIGHKYLDKFFSRFPLIKLLYVPLKQMLEFIFSSENMTFKKAVLIEFPCKGNWSLGFVTNESFQEAKKKVADDLLNVFLPLAFSPATGFVVFVRKGDVIFLEMEIKEAMKLIMSGGVLNPQEITKNA